jgi:hypothetical protein
MHDGMAGYVELRAAFLLVLLFAACALGCASPFDQFKKLDVATVQPGQALLLGRLEIQGLDDPYTTSTWVRTNVGPLEYPVGEEGFIAWLVDPEAGALHFRGLDFRYGWLSLGERPLLKPAAPEEPIVYFGTLVLLLVAGAKSTRAHPLAGSYRLTVRDDADTTLRDLVALNPSLAHRKYVHLLRKKVLLTPDAP